MPGGPGHLALRLAASAVVLTLSLAAIGVPPRDSLTQCTGDKDVRNKPSNLLEVRGGVDFAGPGPHYG